uniref:L27 domain-containing protein n=1 Tax=Heterorhabditis bacteriophora TaxID=37862 RepID=A0A1I7XJ77_HETBA
MEHDPISDTDISTRVGTLQEVLEINESIFAPQPHLESAVLLDSFASTGINGNPKAPSPLNTPRAEELPSPS